MNSTIPHLAFPLTIANGTFQTVEQNSDEEIIGCVDAVLLCPQGHRDLLPDFGLPPLEFLRLGDDRQQLVHDAVAAGEPRAADVLTSEDLTDMAATITVQVQRG